MNSFTGSKCLAAVMVLGGAAAALATATGRAPVDLVPVRVQGVDLGLRFDVLSGLLLAFVGCVGLLVSAFSGRNLQGQARTTRFGRLLTTALVALAVMVTGSSLPVLALGWTVSGLALAALVAHAGTAPAQRAAAYVRRTLVVGDLALWAGVVLAVFVLPSVNRADLAEVTSTRDTLLVAGLLVVACTVRSALVPCQAWLPETAEAPSPVSAFLHAGLVNGAGVMVALYWPVFRAAPAVLLGLLLLGLASVTVGTLAARVRADVKGRLACSTTAQMGYMAIQLGLGLPAAAVLHLIGHGFYKAWLFLRAGGAVSRHRWHAAPGRRADRRGLGREIGWGMLAVVVGAALVAPAFVRSVEALGVTAVVPPLLAVTTAAFAAIAAARTRTTAREVAGRVAVVGGLLAAAYGWLLTGWEHLLSRSLPLQPVWSTGAGVALVAVLAVGAAILVGATGRVVARPDGRLATRVLRTAVAPWARAGGGAAAWPPAPPAGTRLTAEQVAAHVEVAAEVVAPAWPLRTIVAANPLAGFEGLDFADAAAAAGRAFGTRGYLSPAQYARLFDAGRITRADLRTAARVRAVDRGEHLDAAASEVAVDGLIDRSRRAGARDPVAVARVQDRREVQVADAHAALWCQRAWSLALDGGAGPWSLWRAGSRHAAYDGVLRLRGTSALVRSLPAEPAAALAQLLNGAGVPAEAIFGYLSTLLAGLPGWTAHARWRAREASDPAPLIELAAVRVALDLLLVGAPEQSLRARGRRETRTRDAARQEDLAVWQLAFELGFRGPLVEDVGARGAVLSAGTDGSVPTRPAAAQLVFCIDVRSERMRRAVESVGDYATYGFAGFFGAAFRYVSEQGATFDQCPALIRPGFVVTAPATGGGLRMGLRRAALAVGAAPVTPLLVAEAGGELSGIAAALQMLAPRAWQRLAHRWAATPERWGPAELTTRCDGSTAAGLPVGMSDAQRAELAAGALRSIGLVDGFAPLLVVCGHAATVENNAFAAAYDCGACGGNGGHVNARVLAEVLNDDAVRRALALDGIVIPPSTLAVAAVHDTTTDDVTLEPGVDVPADHVDALAGLAVGLAAAGDAVRAERAPTLAGAPRGGASRAALARHARTRASDWSQPAPEWGLAGNAAFVVGPRALTAGLDLGGRAFLHSYEPAADPDGAILETILTAPAVVTQWINAQYYASTVDHEVFGAGDKATHNVVGDVGVLTGAHGDLRLGLPWQALFDRDPRGDVSSTRHEPLRELVLVWAEPRAIEAIVRRHPLLTRLVGNDWFSLAAVDPADGRAWRLTRSLAWVRWPHPTDAVATAERRGPVAAQTSDLYGRPAR